MYSSNLSFISSRFTIALCVPSIVVNFKPWLSALKFTSDKNIF